MGSDTDKKSIQYLQLTRKYITSILSVILMIIIVSYAQYDASISRENEKNVQYTRDKLEKQLLLIKEENRHYKDEISSSTKSYEIAQQKVSQLESQFSNERETLNNLRSDIANLQNERDQLRVSLEESMNGTALLRDQLSQLEGGLTKERESCNEKIGTNLAEKENLQNRNDELNKKLQSIEKTIHLLNTTLHSVKHAEATKGFWEHVQDLVDRII